MTTGLIISITLAVTFLCLYVAAVQDTASVRKDNDAEFGIEFELSGFELYYEHFRDALPHYIQAMNQIISSHKEEYDKLVEAKQNGNDVTGEDGTYTLPGYARGWDA